MELTRKQEEGLRIAVERYRHNEPYTVIAGYAGTGKSTLIKFIVAALDIDPEMVAYVAYTGKAAQVLKSKGCPNAMTAHRLLYKSIPKKDGTFIHIPRDELGVSCDIVVVDEVSMIPQDMWNLLLSHGVYVIACGDPGQLPPVSGSTTVLDHPHIFLDEIMRQARDSEIIRLSADVREGKRIVPFKGTEINIVKQKDYCNGMLTWADQIICGKNVTRNSTNDYFRQMKWGDAYTTEPLVGDKIICLKNNWDKVTGTGDALVNGTIGTLKELYTTPNLWLGTYATIDFLPEEYSETDDLLTNCRFKDLLIDWKLITTHVPTLNKENFRTFPRQLRPEQFDYGYVITCWKAQGSEYDKVLFLAERVGNMDTESYIKYLYTGITRAAKKLTLVLP